MNDYARAPNQPLLTTSSPTFAGLTINGAATFAATVTATTSITTPQVIGTLPNGLTLLAEAGGAYWVLDTAGVWKPGLDNTYDIGTGSKQVRDVYASRYVFAGYFVATGSGAYLFNGRGGVRSSADGVLRLSNDADSDFARLCFGGTTSAFPAIRRVATDLYFRLADDSSYAGVRTGSIGFGNDAYTLSFGSSLDVILSRHSAANLRQGAAAANDADGVAQTLRSPSGGTVSSGTTGRAGGAYTITAGDGSAAKASSGANGGVGGTLTLYGGAGGAGDGAGVTGAYGGVVVCRASGLLGFYGVTPIARAVLATGAGRTVDDVITALQNLGLVKQS